MYNISSFKKILILLLVITTLFFIGYYFLYQDIKAKNEHISVLSEELLSKSNRQEYLKSTSKMIEDIRPDIEKINNSIVAVGGDVDFIENLESLARSNGLSIDISSLTFEDDKVLAASNTTKFKIKAKTVGGWAGSYAFLSEIESLPFKISINSFVINNIPDKASEKVVPGKDWLSTFEIVVLKYK